MEMLIAHAIEAGGPWVMLLVQLPILALIVGAFVVTIYALNKARQHDP
ncbi:hypothetical protein OHB26_39620 (plasmid) [Nocardia sp. NBC_01503]|nr:hypothetical protein [Nocardia sp. NBC_01503]WTL36659.1 hypothetical protein OHB26_38955 [Nocardia sp. NBC_01503]WTL36788.1 hypothetical protein OHB26_39620 [Nocardia sp. NBC_01503]